MTLFILFSAYSAFRSVERRLVFSFCLFYTIFITSLLYVVMSCDALQDHITLISSYLYLIIYYISGLALLTVSLAIVRVGYYRPYLLANIIQKLLIGFYRVAFLPSLTLIYKAQGST